MPSTMTLIAASTVGSGGASTITFSSIPQTYTDLVIVASGRLTSSANSDWILKFNGSSTGYTQRYMIGTGSSVVSGTQTYGQIGIMGGTATTAGAFNTNYTYIPNYTSSKYKTFTSDDAYETNGTAKYSSFWLNLWANTAAVTSIELSSFYTIAQHTTAYLYGVSNS